MKWKNAEAFNARVDKKPQFTYPVVLIRSNITSDGEIDVWLDEKVTKVNRVIGL